MILRRLARPLLASIFIYGGINTLRNSKAQVQIAQPLLDKFIGKNADALPDFVPTDAESLVKLDAKIKIGAGAALALGKMPRLASLVLFASLVPTTAAGHPFWEKTDPAERKTQLLQFLKNSGIAGGLLLAVADTHAKPSLGWRARRAARKAGHEVQEASESLQQGVRGMCTTSRRLMGK